MQFIFLLLFMSLFLGRSVNLKADVSKNSEVPIKKVTLYSSGVGYFEHKGYLENSSKLSFLFEKNALNDVLKSMIIYDPTTELPLISYSSEETFRRTLESLSINLENNPTLIEILNALRGAEIEISTDKKITGKIMGAEVKKIKTADGIIDGGILSILTKEGIELIKIDEITSYNFTDKKIADDINRALEFILESKNQNIKSINIYLAGDKKREIEISYVIASPVWKATYRFDITEKKPYFQGWAIVDNVGEMDWKDVELSLVTGRPVSFIQELYPPYHLNRPILPLSIAGFANAKVHESGFSEISEISEMAYADMSFEKASKFSFKRDSGRAGNTPVTNVRSAGEMFVFTSPKPITLERQQSAMIPLMEGAFEIKKLSIFDGGSARMDMNTNPVLGVSFKNSSGMKLPAGPITVYDDGTYVGDALLEFLPENETRMISYGDDLSVSGIISTSLKNYSDFVSVSDGVLKINKRDIYERVYHFKNSSKNLKNIILEHPFIQNSKLIEPQKYYEKTAAIYRFEIELPSNKELKFPVKEEIIKTESIYLSNLDSKTLMAYSSNSSIPKDVQNLFKKAASLHQEVENINMELTNLKGAYAAKLTEQDRIRKNIDTVKNDSTQGKEYIKRLVELDKDIENINNKIEENTVKIQILKKEYSNYIYSLK
ncbi:hypothetical protein [Fusobacterium sp.]|uniref:hypothetical protein n=1 Tax=Fusobacterium sp. TaxID=68766 RepID=UPI0028FF3A2F|nr:hypothetical protein [Fusobacterium sp.]MDU1911617.1 hypothetical protein [Fusobacterium sp.]